MAGESIAATSTMQEILQVEVTTTRDRNRYRIRALRCLSTPDSLSLNLTLITSVVASSKATSKSHIQQIDTTDSTNKQLNLIQHSILLPLLNLDPLQTTRISPSHPSRVCVLL
jgi:hypothetical protein